MKNLFIFKQFPATGLLRQIWQAPYKNDESLKNAILDYSSRGFFCQVFDTPKTIDKENSIENHLAQLSQSEKDLINLNLAC